MTYIQIAIAPIIVILSYIYYRDRYNKEPFWILFLLFMSGVFSVIPVLITGFFSDFLLPYLKGLYQVAYTAFIQAALIEEFWKLLFIFVIAWWAKSFDERFDGIVYAVTVSMGFAAVENVMYVTGYGLYTGLLRTVTAVPAHAIFGITMGYYIGKAKFDKDLRAIYLLLAFILPWLMHGIYDFLIMAGVPWMTYTYIIFLILMYVYGFMRLKNLSRYKEQEKNKISNTGLNSNIRFNVSDSKGFEPVEKSNIENTTPNYQNYNTASNYQQAPNQNMGGYNNTQYQQYYNQQQDPRVNYKSVENLNNNVSTSNLETLSVLYYVKAALSAIALFSSLIYVAIILMFSFSFAEDSGFILSFIFIISFIISFVFLSAFVIINVLSAIYLKKKKNRTFCLIVAFIACLNAPLGTLLGIFTIIELQKPEIKSLFENT